MLLEKPLADGMVDDLEEIMSISGIKGKNVTMQDAILLSQMQKAAKGDTKAASLVLSYYESRMAENTDGGVNIHDDFTD